ncbi:LytS/YhcK type 5TM receptor domain-containing protein [Niallia sp. Krafla_26]|uniref:LytS/YhcK type 5TM receptor domain-containing protein n=1 Tax=Niallia sp. Krafla_26 TaxID=3064703 RepID=UPI003D167BE0
MFDLLLLMIERLGIIVMIAFILTRLSFFRKMALSDKLNKRQQLFAMIFFGVFGIIGTYSGFTFNSDSLSFERWKTDLLSDEAIANFRVIGVVMAGILGGYKIGLGAGIIAGTHRLLLGGYTAFSCGIATIIAGFLAGVFYRKDSKWSLSKTFVITALAEVIQMILILLVSRPFDKVVHLVEIIGLPMVIANGFGGALFMLIIQNVFQQEEKISANQAQLTLRIAGKTLAHLRKGLNERSAIEVCDILHRETGAVAVSITNKVDILAHVGLGDDHHKQKNPIQTEITKEALQTGNLVMASGKKIHCQQEDCPLHSVVVAPLKPGGTTIGTLKFYFQSKREISPIVKETVSGLSNLLSNQLELAAAHQTLQLAKEAEIKALQAQMNPHFLFNSLNTIVSLIRTNPMKARKLLVSLSHFLRQNVTSTTVTVTTVEQELKHLKAFLDIAETRFQDRLYVHYKIDDTTLHAKIPPFTLQPIVENAMKHGLKNKKTDCHITITIQSKENHISVSVSDNGIGITSERLDEIGKGITDSESGTGLALYNINQRLCKMYGKDAALMIDSIYREGTNVHFTIPK